MRLKNKVTKDEHAALPADLQACYVASGDSFVLDSEEATGLKTARDAEAEAARIARERAATAEAALAAREEADRAAAEELARKNKDIETLETSWQTRLATSIAAENAKTERLQRQLEARLVDDVASVLANEISISPALLLPHIRARLKADTSGDVATTRVVDANGNLTAFTVADLRKELIDNKDFSHIIKASLASGGGAGGGGGGGGAGPLDPQGKKIKDMTEQEKTTLYRADPAEYNRRVAAEKAA